MIKTIRFHGAVVDVLSPDGKWNEFSTLPDAITQFKELPNGSFIAHTSQGSGKTNDQNIFLLDASGRIVWQIQKAPPPPDPFYPNRPNPYNDAVWTDGKLYACTQCGDEYEVDLVTGKITYFRFVK